MSGHVDLGVRCDRHVGEVFPPRCRDCDAENAAAAADAMAYFAGMPARTSSLSQPLTNEGSIGLDEDRHEDES